MLVSHSYIYNCILDKVCKCSAMPVTSAVVYVCMYHVANWMICNAVEILHHFSVYPCGADVLRLAKFNFGLRVTLT